MEWTLQPSTTRRFWRSSLSVICCALILAVSQNAVVSADKEPTWNTSRIHQCITDLSSSNFRARNQATRELKRAGAPAVELLLRSAQSDDAEVVWRSKHILIQLAAGDSAIIDLLEQRSNVQSSASDSSIAEHILRCPKVQAANKNRYRTKMAKLLQQAETHLLAGRYKLARGNAIAADALNIEYNLADAAPEQVLWGIDRIAAESGDQAAKKRWMDLSKLPKRKRASVLLSRARTELRNGRVDLARQYAITAKCIDVKYGVFDDRPALVLAEVDRIAAGDAIIEKLGPLDRILMTRKARMIERNLGFDHQSPCSVFTNSCSLLLFWHLVGSQ